jgi:hypothetical protein
MVNVQFYMQVCKIDTSHNLKDWFIYLIIELEVYVKRQKEGWALRRNSSWVSFIQTETPFGF